MNFKLIAPAAAALALLGGAALAQDVPMLMVEGGTYKGQSLIVPEVTMDKPGFIVVHDIVGGAPVVPGSVAHVAVPAGSSKFVSVPIENLMSGHEYMLMLHYDTNANGEYEFGEGKTDVDTPVMTADGMPVMMSVLTE